MNDNPRDPLGRSPEEEQSHFSRLLLDSLGEGVFGVDRAGNFTFLNQAAVRIFGFRDQASVLGANSHTLTHHTDSEGGEHPASACRIYQVMATGQPLEAWRDLFWRTDGSSFPTEVYANPVIDGHGEVTGAVVSFRDITEQRRRERDLAQFQAAFEASRDAVMLSTPDGFLDCNPATVALFKAPDAASVIGRHPGELSPPTQEDGTPSQEAAAERMDKALREGEAFFEWIHRTFSGTDFPAEVLLSRVDLEDGPILQAVVRDISEKKAAIEDLRRARNRAEQYFEAARVMNLVLDPQGRIEEINSRACELLGISKSYALGRDWFATFLPEEEAPRMREVFAGFLSGDIHPGGNLENEVIAAGGERRLLSFRHSVLQDQAGRIQGLLSSGEDVTHQRDMEAELAFRATNDVLTGQYNRRRFEEFLEQEIDRSDRYGSRFSLIMFDVDGFKAVNDQYGHDIGDRILTSLAATVSQRTREADILGRWGGEEFMILLPETPREGALKLAEDVRERVAAARFPGPGAITISLGCVEFQPGERQRNLTKRVDDALYRAKAGGRNRVVSE